MTDREAFKKMLEKAGVKNRDVLDGQGYVNEQVDTTQSVVTVYSNDNFPNGGYSGFFTEFVFNEDGSLDKIGAWE